MNEANHHKVVELAIPVLPERSQAFWAPRMSQITATCMWADAYAIALLNSETGHWRPYFPLIPFKHSFEKLGAPARIHFFDLRFYIEQILATLSCGEIEECCRFLGVLSHHFGDFAEPAHYYEADITLLLQPPPDQINCNPHRMIEDINSTVSAITHNPRVLGDTVDSIIMRLEGSLRDLYEASLATIIPLMMALYARDMRAAAQLTDPIVAKTAAVMADVLHTCWCVQSGQWTAEERQTLATCRLDALEPALYDGEFNYGFRPMRKAITLDKIGHAIPLQLRVSEEPTTRPVEGLCLVPHALPISGTKYLTALEYELPVGSFNRLTCVAGLLAGITPQAPCHFAVETDGNEIYRSPEINESDIALDINLDITNRRHLRLVVYTDGSTDKLAFPIWGMPKLCRTI